LTFAAISRRNPAMRNLAIRITTTTATRFGGPPGIVVR
jgi:hypothetical protein